MKKVIVLFLVCCSAFSLFAQNDTAGKSESADKPQPVSVSSGETSPANAEFTTYDRIVYNVAFYPVNRLMDFYDIITWGAGAGSENAVFLRVTNYMQFGGAIGGRYFISNVTKKTYPTDQEELAKYLVNYLPYGAGHYKGWNYGFLCFAAENTSVTEAMGRVEKYEYSSDFGIPSFKGEIYKNKIRDFWAIEAHVASGWEFDIAFHPIEIADFVFGFLFIDIISDDDI